MANADGEFKLAPDRKLLQKKLPLPRPAPGQPAQPRAERRKKDSVRLVWDSKPKRPPSPRDIEFQTAEVVIPNPARDEKSLPLSFHDGVLGNEEIDRTKMNRLIWGDNLLAMQALLASGYEGKIDLIYIDPPFDSKADYSHQTRVRGGSVTREPSVIEQLAYTDTWEAGTDSYLDMLYPRFHLMKRLLSETGSIYVHMDYHCGHMVKVMLDEVFGKEQFRNEIVWQRTNAHNEAGQYGRIHDTIFFYTKGEQHVWHPKTVNFSEKQLARYRPDKNGRLYTTQDLCADRKNSESGRFNWRGTMPPVGRGWGYMLEQLEEWWASGRIMVKKDGTPRMDGLIVYLDEKDGQSPQSIWTDVSRVANTSEERLGFTTQKSEALLERIVETSSDKASVVADFFCGSGTTLAVAERLGRPWIGCDLGKVGIQVTRSRLVHQDAKPFLIENIGNYQREMIYLTGGRIYEMQRIILKLYGASVHPHYKDLGTRPIELAPDGSRGSLPSPRGTGGIDPRLPSGASTDNTETELVYVGYPDRPTTARKVEELAKQAETLDGTGYNRLIILAWDYDYSFDTEWEARQKRMKRKLEVEVQRRMIPPDVYDYLKKAKDEEEVYKLADKVVFHQKPMFRLRKPKVGKAKEGQCEVTIAIDKYLVFDLPVAEKEREKLREAMKDNFAILIDYWAVDWDYDGATFRSEWQAIRGNGKRARVVPTETTHALKAGKTCTIAVRVVDVFGNDAAATCEVKT